MNCLALQLGVGILGLVAHHEKTRKKCHSPLHTFLSVPLSFCFPSPMVPNVQPIKNEYTVSQANLYFCLQALQNQPVTSDMSDEFNKKKTWRQALRPQNTSNLILFQYTDVCVLSFWSFRILNCVLMHEYSTSLKRSNMSDFDTLDAYDLHFQLVLYTLFTIC